MRKKKIKNFLSDDQANITIRNFPKTVNQIRKETKIKDGVFIGSNSALIAPITINKKSIIGAGSVITRNVKEKSLALTRSKQTEVRNYKRK